MQPIKVAILGGSGYTAVELIQILLRHPHVEIVAITSRDVQPISDYHTNLYGRIDIICEPFDAVQLKEKGVEVAFGCLPHGTSMEVVPQLLEQGIRVVDLSADYRLRDAEVYKQWYGAVHGDRDNLDHAVYGLPEFFAGAIKTAKLIANPGCYPQTAILGLTPLLQHRLIEPSNIIVDSKSGVSGAGRSLKLTTLYPECNENFSAYNVGTHRHTPEMEQALHMATGTTPTILFVPHLVPMDRGILSTIYATPMQMKTQDELLTLYRDYYKGKPFIRIRDGFPTTKATAHTNYLDVTVRVVRDRIVVIAAEDNLVRGASGVAVQNFNLMFGFDETMGLI